MISSGPRVAVTYLSALERNAPASIKTRISISDWAGRVFNRRVPQFTCPVLAEDTF
jgi:hypothetical protein